MDLDGVLTDGRLYYHPDGSESKVFHVLDGHGIVLLREAGIKSGVLSGRTSKSAEFRIKELAMDESRLGISDKLTEYEKLIRKLGVQEDETAYIGDDLPDLPVLKRVGLSLAVANAVDRVKDQVDWVTKKGGGTGAVREAIDLILSAREGDRKGNRVGFLKP
jgi:3-deoxy-D-manno-octulosonate 8-phosphate phosphatase (KDO 8-P phosphatase)